MYYGRSFLLLSVPQSFTLLEKAIGFSFQNKDLLAQALTHRSAIRESRAHGDNERLEFLGDAVLEFIITESLFQRYDKPEGELTNWRSALVNGENLASVAQELKLGDYIFMSAGEEMSGGREKSSTLSNTIEALIGAVYLDRGIEAAREFCYHFVLKRLPELIKQGKDRDEKSLFQEKAQELFGITPHYELVSDEGPDHDKLFRCAVIIGDLKIAEGEGNSKQRAEQAAARAGLKAKKWA